MSATYPPKTREPFTLFLPAITALCHAASVQQYGAIGEADTWKLLGVLKALEQIEAVDDAWIAVQAMLQIRKVISWLELAQNGLHPAIDCELTRELVQTHENLRGWIYNRRVGTPPVPGTCAVVVGERLQLNAK